MGNLLHAPVSDTSKHKEYVQHQQNDDTATRSQQPGKAPPPRPPRPPSRSNSTDNMVDNIDKHLTDLKESVRTLKGGKQSETKQQLLKMMSETERDLHNLNQQMQPKMKQVGNSIFYTSLEGDNEVLQDVLSVNEIHCQKIADLEATLETERKMTQEFLQKNKTLQANADKLEEENATLMLRLSKVAGDRLVENNPAIADLTDRNRPTKLGEMYSELYDNEWTDAFEALRAEDYDEEFAICTLHLTLVNVFDYCTQTSDRMLQKTEDAVNFLFKEFNKLQTGSHHMSMPQGRVSNIKLTSKFIEDIQLQERWKLKSAKEDKNSHSVGTLRVEKSDVVPGHIKTLRKEISESMVPVVQKAYTSACWIDGEFVPELKPFLRKCTFLCWMMVVQTPSMNFHMVEAGKDVKFDKNMYKEYTSSGPLIKYVVWPALLLHENGPMVSKGIAQGCDYS